MPENESVGEILGCSKSLSILSILLVQPPPLYIYIYVTGIFNYPSPISITPQLILPLPTSASLDTRYTTLPWSASCLLKLLAIFWVQKNLKICRFQILTIPSTSKLKNFIADCTLYITHYLVQNFVCKFVPVCFEKNLVTMNKLEAHSLWKPWGMQFWFYCLQ